MSRETVAETRTKIMNEESNLKPIMLTSMICGKRLLKKRIKNGHKPT